MVPTGLVNAFFTSERGKCQSQQKMASISNNHDIVITTMFLAYVDYSVIIIIKHFKEKSLKDSPIINYNSKSFLSFYLKTRNFKLE